jgi:hypothetical protein
MLKRAERSGGWWMGDLGNAWLGVALERDDHQTVLRMAWT